MKFKLVFLTISIFYFSQNSEAFNMLEIPQNISSYLQEEILPPSPTAYSLGQYGNVAPSLVSGAISQSIPLYIFKCGELELPISMGYNSTGIKVDQTASWVGLGWNLLAGGVINRVVMDEPDERGTRFSPSTLEHYSVEFGDFLTNYEQYDLQPDVFTFNFNGYSGSFRYDGQKFIIAPYQNLQITSDAAFNWFKIKLPDGVEYSFNVVETSRNPSSSKQLMSTDNKTAWYCNMITHPRGDIIYLEYNNALPFTYWTGISQTFTKAFDAAPGVMDVDEGYQCIYVNSRSLKKIWSPKYGAVFFASSLGRQDLNDVKLDSISIYTYDNKFFKKFAFSYTNVQCNGPSAKFGPNSLQYRLFLDALSEESGNLPSNKLIHQFEYYNRSLMPWRLSFSQDHWGYYNGSAGTDFVSNDYANIFDGRGTDRKANPTYGGYGLLQKITYPTKGWTTIDYEPQSYYGITTITPPPVNTTITALGTGTPKTNLEYIDIPFAQTIVISFDVTYSNGIPNDNMKAILEIANDESPIPVVYELLASAGHMVINFPCLLNKYSFKITAYGVYTNAGITVTYYTEPPYTEYANINTGGMRVFRIKNFDGINSSPQIKRYFYNKYIDRSKSSGIKGFEPVYYSQVNRKAPKDGNPCGDNNSHVCSSNSLNSIYTLSGDYINYPYVTESFGENFEAGGKEYEYGIFSDQSGGLLFGYNFIIGTPLNNESWQNGKLLSEKTFKVISGSQIITSETKNLYNIFEGSEVPGYTVARDVEGDCTFGYAFVTDCSPNKEESIIMFECIDNCGNSVVAGPQDKEFMVCVNLDCSNEFTFYPILGFNYNSCKSSQTGHVHNYKWVNSSQFMWKGKIGKQYYGIYAIDPCYFHPGEQLARNEIFEQYSVMEYKFYSNVSLLDSTLTTTYDASGNNPVTTKAKYYYENPLHMQPTRIKTWLSDGKVKELLPRLSSDYYFDESLGIPTNESSKGVYYLLANNVINSPIEYCEKINGSVVKGQVLTYNFQNNIVYPDRYYEWFGTPSTGYTSLTMNQTSYLLDPNYSERIKYLYNLYSNLIQTDYKDNNSVSYIWGYNNSLPVIKAENLSNTNLTAAVNTATSNLETLLTNIGNMTTDAQKNLWKTFNTSLRANALTNSLISTFTYKPLIGITSETDPNGVATYYEYDTLGRLKLVKDDSGNILKTFEYHYKQ